MITREDLQRAIQEVYGAEGPAPKRRLTREDLLRAIREVYGLEAPEEEEGGVGAFFSEIADKAKTAFQKLTQPTAEGMMDVEEMVSRMAPRLGPTPPKIAASRLAMGLGSPRGPAQKPAVEGPPELPIPLTHGAPDRPSVGQPVIPKVAPSSLARGLPVPRPSDFPVSVKPDFVVIEGQPYYKLEALPPAEPVEAPGDLPVALTYGAPDRPDAYVTTEPGLEMPSPLLDPVEYMIGAGVGGMMGLLRGGGEAALAGLRGLASRFATRGAAERAAMEAAAFREAGEALPSALEAARRAVSPREVWQAIKEGFRGVTTKEAAKKAAQQAAVEAGAFPVVGEVMHAGGKLAAEAGAPSWLSFLTSLASGAIAPAVAMKAVQAVGGEAAWRIIRSMMEAGRPPEEIARAMENMKIEVPRLPAPEAPKQIAASRLAMALPAPPPAKVLPAVERAAALPAPEKATEFVLKPKWQIKRTYPAGAQWIAGVEQKPDILVKVRTRKGGPVRIIPREKYLQEQAAKETEKAARKTPLLAELPEGATGYKSPILTFIRKHGGIRPDEYYAGEIERFGLKEGGTTGLLRKKGLHADHMRELLEEEGLLSEGSTVSDLFDLMDAELRRERGTPKKTKAEFLAEQEEATREAFVQERARQIEEEGIYADELKPGEILVTKEDVYRVAEVTGKGTVLENAQGERITLEPWDRIKAEQYFPPETTQSLEELRRIWVGEEGVPPKAEKPTEEKPELPDLKSADEADDFGLQVAGDKEMIGRLREKYEELGQEAERLRNEGKDAEALDMSQKAQFYREAAETAEAGKKPELVKPERKREQEPLIGEPAVTLEQLREHPNLANYVLKRRNIHSDDVVAEAERIATAAKPKGQVGEITETVKELSETTGIPETFARQIASALADMVAKAKAAGRPNLTPKEAFEQFMGEKPPEGVIWIKEGDYVVIENFMRRVEDWMKSLAPDSTVREKVLDYIRQLRRIVGKIAPDPATTINDQTIGIARHLEDLENIIRSSEIASVEDIGITGRGETLYRVWGKGYAGEAVPESKLLEKGIEIPFLKSRLEREYKERLAEDLFPEIYNNLTVRDINASEGDALHATLKRALSEGKRVPREVLEEYPDLLARYGTRPKGQVGKITEADSGIQKNRQFRLWEQILPESPAKEPIVDPKTGDIPKSLLKRILEDERGMIKLSEEIDDPNFVPWKKRKDLRKVYQLFQYMYDIAKSHPKMRPLWEAEWKRFGDRNEQIYQAYETARPYFEMKPKARQKVDKVLLEGDRKKVIFKDSDLRKRGLNDEQIEAYKAIRKALDNELQRMVEAMREAEIPEEKIAEFIREHRGYVPHKWYGKWALVVKVKKPQKAFEFKEESPREKWVTVHMETSDSRALLRSKVLPKLREAFGPDAKILEIKRSKVKDDLYRDVIPPQVSQLLEKAVQKGSVTPQTADALRAALDELYKAKGFGAHFIRRRNVAGYTEDLAKPLAEYFIGAAGYRTKIQAVRDFAKALREIPADTNLGEFARSWVRYNLGVQHTPVVNAVKSLLFYKYLGLNVKSALVNLSGIHLSYARLGSRKVGERFPAVKIIRAMGRTAYDALGGKADKVLSLLKKSSQDVARRRLKDWEKEAFEYAERRGYFNSQYADELVAQIQGPFRRMVSSRFKSAMTAFFRTSEEWVRRASYLAFLRAGAKKGLKGKELYEWAIRHVQETQGYYMKGNRNLLQRTEGMGLFTSPLMTFRGWMLNYLHFLKNTVKDKDAREAIRALLGMFALAGVMGQAGSQAVSAAYFKLTKKDLETEIRKIFGKKWGRLVARGPLSYVLGIDLSGSIGAHDIFPSRMEDVLGVAKNFFYDQPRKFIRDIEAGEYYRAAEDFPLMPEIGRQALSGYRLATRGATTRGGTPLIDPLTGKQIRLTPKETLMKIGGFQPERLSEGYRLSRVIAKVDEERARIKRQFLDRMANALQKGDGKAYEQAVKDWQEWNFRHVHQPEMQVQITAQDIQRRLKSRRPSKRTMPLVIRAAPLYRTQ
jgi:hypothetical protein